MIRRIRRIYPTYWSALGLFFLIALPCYRFFSWTLSKVPFHDGTLGQWIGNLTLTETWRPMISSSAEKLFLDQAWSLCYEEQFYAVVGLCIVLGRYFPLGILTITAFSLYFSIDGIISGQWLGFRLFFDYHWLFFAIGIGVYWSVTYLAPKSKTLGWAMLLMALATAVFGAGIQVDPLIFFSAASALGAILLICHADDELISRMLVVRALSWIGGFSYSLYLTHRWISFAAGYLLLDYAKEWPLTALGAAVVLNLLISIPLGAWFYHYFEKPWQRKVFLQ